MKNRDSNQKNRSTMNYDFDMSLIQHVKKNPDLYKCGKPKKDMRLKRETRWREIATKINQDPEICKKRWKNLRDQYVRYKKMGNHHLMYMDGSLRFLDDVISCTNKSKISKRTKSNVLGIKDMSKDIADTEDAVKGENVTYVTQDMIQILLNSSKVNDDVSEIATDSLVALVKSKLEETFIVNLPKVHNNLETIGLYSGYQPIEHRNIDTIDWDNRNQSRENNNIETIDLDEVNQPKEHKNIETIDFNIGNKPGEHNLETINWNNENQQREHNNIEEIDLDNSNQPIEHKNIETIDLYSRNQPIEHKTIDTINWDGRKQPRENNNIEAIDLDNGNRPQEYSYIKTIDMNSEIEVANNSLEKKIPIFSSNLMISKPECLPHLMHQVSYGSLNVTNEKSQDIDHKSHSNIVYGQKTPNSLENVQSSKGLSILKSIITAKPNWPKTHLWKRPLEILNNEAQCESKLATNKTHTTLIEDTATFFSKVAERVDQLPLDVQTDIKFKVFSIILNAELKSRDK